MKYLTIIFLLTTSFALGQGAANGTSLLLRENSQTQIDGFQTQSGYVRLAWNDAEGEFQYRVGSGAWQSLATGVGISWSTPVNSNIIPDDGGATLYSIGSQAIPFLSMYSNAFYGGLIGTAELTSAVAGTVRFSGRSTDIIPGDYAEGTMFWNSTTKKLRIQTSSTLIEDVAIGGGGSGDFLADGSVPMTGSFDAGGFSIGNSSQISALDGVFTNMSSTGQATVFNLRISKSSDSNIEFQHQSSGITSRLMSDTSQGNDLIYFPDITNLSSFVNLSSISFDQNKINNKGKLNLNVVTANYTFSTEDIEVSTGVNIGKRGYKAVTGSNTATGTVPMNLGVLGDVLMVTVHTSTATHSVTGAAGVNFVFHDKTDTNTSFTVNGPCSLINIGGNFWEVTGDYTTF